MCKVLIIPAIKKHKIKETMVFLRAMGMSMSKSNNDGLGYSAINAAGDMFGERWFVNTEAFKPVVNKPVVDFTDMKTIAEQSLGQFGKALKYHKTGSWTKEPDVPRYNKFGTDVLENAVAITLHTRAATCDKNLMNVHPFVDLENDTSVIHNGVITNSKEFDLKVSTCDSESILISYLRNGVNKDINEVQKMVDELKGYYACGVFSRDGEGNRILDVFKFNNNNLSISYIYDLETYVLTSSDYELKEMCKALGYSHDGTQDVHDDYITRINPFTGEIIAQAEYTKPVVTTPYYNDYQEWDYKTRSYKKKEPTKTATSGAGETKLIENKGKVQKTIDEHLAKMWELKSSIQEHSVQDVETFTTAAGWDN